MGGGVRLCSNKPARAGGRLGAIRNPVLARDACLGDAAISLDEKARDLSDPRMFKPLADRSLLRCAGGAPFDGSTNPGWPILCVLLFFAKGGPTTTAMAAAMQPARPE
jgi:hypothetical protein